jgi:hypothetical protein
MELKEIILSEIREPWAIKKGFDTWDQFNYEGDADAYMETDYFVHREALDRLDKVMRWAMMNGWVINQLGPFYHPHDDRAATDAELYELFKSQSE